MSTTTEAINPAPRLNRPRTLSKSDFKLARSCDAKLYFRENGYTDHNAYDPYLQFLAEGGYMAEALAKAKYPEGTQLEYGGDTQADLRRTLDYLQRDNVTLFEATLTAGRRLARADIIQKRGNTIRLIEVKVKSFDGDEHRESLMNGGKGIFWTERKNPTLRSDWLEKLEDVTFQALILEEMLPSVKVLPFLALIDKSKRTVVSGIPSHFEILYDDRPDGTRRLRTARYTGDEKTLAQIDLITELPVAEEVDALRDVVKGQSTRFEGMLDSSLHDYMNGLERSSKCASCEFRGDPLHESGFAHCWGPLAHSEPHFLELYKVGNARGPGWTPLVEHMWQTQKSALADIPIESIAKKDGTIGPDAARQRRQITNTISGETYVAASLRSRIESVTWPAYFIDFETSRLALPSHEKMRPYGSVTFQWSCHKVANPGAAPEHSEWLNTDDIWPNQTFAEKLRAAIGDRGAVVTWSPFENVTLRQIVADLAEFGRDVPELVQWLQSVESRIVDLHEWARDDYYHPGMGGKTGIKAVMDALWKSDATMRTQAAGWMQLKPDEALDPYYALAPVNIDGADRVVRDGTGAMRAYDAMMYGPGRNDPDTKARWAKLLKQYCHLDTLSMILIFEHWRRVTGLA